MSTGDAASADGQNVSGSVCPLGWQLPKSKVTTSGSFGGLTSAYGIGNDATGSTALRSSPLYFQYGGRVYSGYLRSAGSDGRYWSSTARDANNAYNLAFSPGGVDPSYYYNRYVGFSVRCLVQEP